MRNLLSRVGAVARKARLLDRLYAYSLGLAVVAVLNAGLPH